MERTIFPLEREQQAGHHPLPLATWRGKGMGELLHRARSEVAREVSTFWAKNPVRGSPRV